MNTMESQDETEKLSFTEEIKMMMFGLGDSPTPLESTAAVIEEIITKQLVMIIFQAEEVADRRGVDGIYPQDILFLMRKDIHKLNRIINYISFKDMKKNVTSSLNDGNMPGLEVLLPAASEVTVVESKRKMACIQFLHSIGIDLDEQIGGDAVKQDRLRRNDLRVQSMSEKTYEDFNQSRRTTFIAARFGNDRFLDWIKQSCPDCPINKLKSYAVEMLSYLAKETVAQIIDIALLLRQDARVIPGDPYSRAQQVVLPFETYGPSQRLLEGPPAISPDEVREVIRRYYSTQLCPWGAFNANVNPAVYDKIIAC